jgi:murein DD-endopeptidase MepM/ murein hydrolase activator NlpD
MAASVTLLAVPTLTATETGAPTLASVGSERGDLQEGQWPIPPAAIVTGFDDPTPYSAGHRGIDLAATVGQVVTASRTGIVTVAGDVAGRPVVVLRHPDATRTTYLPVIAAVRIGERVEVGDPIGTLAGSGHCLATTCLHWGARRGDRYIDPRTLLATDAGLIVLLPVDPVRF